MNEGSNGEITRNWLDNTRSNRWTGKFCIETTLYRNNMITRRKSLRVKVKEQEVIYECSTLVVANTISLIMFVQAVTKLCNFIIA